MIEIDYCNRLLLMPQYNSFMFNTSFSNAMTL